MVTIKTVLDGFSGSTRVSQAFAQNDFWVTANDTAVYSEVLGTCYLKSVKSDSFYQPFLDELNALPGIDGWFTENYGGSLSDAKKPFQFHNTRKLDAIRDKIDEYNLDFVDKSVLLTSLLLAMDEVDSTLGHQASYLNKWSARSFKTMKMRLPKRFVLSQHNKVLRGDIFGAIQGRNFDLAYFDPPYGSNNEKMPSSRVRYNAFYHIWTSIVLNDKPKLFGKAKRREDSRDLFNPSLFEEYRKDESGNFIALNHLDQLLKETNAHYILLSYSSGGRATKESLLDILAAIGKFNLAEIDYKKNVMSAMTWTNDWVKTEDDHHKEYLFMLEK